MFLFVFQRPPHFIDRAYRSGSVYVCTLLPHVAAGCGVEDSVACAGGKGTGRRMELPLHVPELQQAHRSGVATAS